MADQLPLVIAPDPNANDGSVIMQRLQPGDGLKIPLEDRVEELELKLQRLTLYLVQIGIDIPEELLL